MLSGVEASLSDAAKCLMPRGYRKNVNRPLFKQLAWFGSVLGASFWVSAIALFMLTRPSLKVVKTWEKPGASMYLTVYESDTDWRGFPLNAQPRYAIYVGRSGTPSYGHYIDMSFYGLPKETDSIRQSSVAWSDQGVTIRQPSGHVLFIPKAMYEGGR